MTPRLTFDEYALQIAVVVAKRSTCTRRQVGAVAVKDKRILATGYNGAPSRTIDCLSLGCLRTTNNIPSGTRHEICRAVHAEQNVIIQAALAGGNLEGATIYCTHTPCIICAKMLVNTRITRLVAIEGYPDEEFYNLFREAGIKIESLEKETRNLQ